MSKIPMRCCLWEKIFWKICWLKVAFQAFPWFPASGWDEEINGASAFFNPENFNLETAYVICHLFDKNDRHLFMIFCRRFATLFRTWRYKLRGGGEGWWSTSGPERRKAADARIILYSFGYFSMFHAPFAGFVGAASLGDTNQTKRKELLLYFLTLRAQRENFLVRTVNVEYNVQMLSS